MKFARLAKRFGVDFGRFSTHPDAWPSATWRAAAADDWPPNDLLIDDLDWLRKTGTGFVTEFQGKKWFLFDRDWFGWPDPPEWGLASFDPSNEGWRFYNDFDVLPENWIVPKSDHAQD